MSGSTPLIVPIVVEAFVLNEPTATDPHNSFQRWTMNYSAYEFFSNIEPGGLSVGPIPPFPYPAIYLKWRLPNALLMGNPSSPANPGRLLPNRWLIVRYDGPADARTPTAWIVESDSPSSAPRQPLGGTPLLLPGQAPDQSYVGVAAQLDPSTGWSEPSPSAPLWLTAFSNGSPAFAFYQPFCNTIFSLIDTDVPASSSPGDDDVISYFVAGWYSNADADPLANGEFAAVMKALDWSVDLATGDAVPNFTLYTGFVTSIPWQNTVELESPVPDGVVKIGVGGTSAEALAALVDAEMGDAPDAYPDLFAALQLNLLRLLDQPDGEGLLAEAVQAKGFQKFNGGYAWTIVDAPGESPALSPEETLREAALVAELNLAQLLYDAASRQLASLRQQLYWTWYDALAPLNSDRALLQQLDPTQSGTLARSVQDAIAETFVLQHFVPNGATAKELAASIAAYAARHHLPKGRLLKRLVRPPFLQPNEPVVLFTGAGASGLLPPGQEPLVCRLASQLVEGVACDGQIFCASTAPIASTPSAVPVDVPQFDFSNITGVPWSVELMQSLIVDYFFEDPANATMITAQSPSLQTDVSAAMQNPANAVGTPPSTIATAPWTGNPWRPLLLRWQGNYFPFTGTPPADLSFMPSGSELSQTPTTLSGLIVLTPAAAFNIANQLAAFLQSSNPELQIGTPAWDQLQAILTTLGSPSSSDPGSNWDMISQALDGFNEQILGLQSGVFRAPQDPPYSGYPPHATKFTTLLGTTSGYPPNGSNFNSWRCGQFAFITLELIDEWGQQLFVLGNAETSQNIFATPPEMTPPGQTTQTTPIMQVPAGLLQPARLQFELLSAVNDLVSVWADPSADPICGWIVHNFLDQSLMIYDATGDLLGELAVGLGAPPPIAFTAAPNAPPLVNAHMRGFVAWLRALSSDELTAWMAAVDTAVSNIVPQGNTFNQSLGLVAGRPLALVRARLQLQLDGPPPQSPLSTSSNPLPTYPFAVELGNAEQVTDGLVGYFAGDTYKAFNIVQASGVPAGEWLSPIGSPEENFLTLSFGGPWTYVSMLIDPRLPVHASTLILPVQTAQVASTTVAEALAQMSVSFRVGSVLTDAHTPSTVAMPLPSQQGTWSWFEQRAQQWGSLSLTQSDATAHLSSVRPVLRRGLLSLIVPTGKETNS